MDAEKIISLAEETRFSGVISLSNKDDIVFEQAFGYRDRANRINNDIDTKFGIASGTKMFTALAVLKLIEQGRLSFKSRALDIVDYDFELYDHSITVLELLNHMSGMPDYFDEDVTQELEIELPWYALREPEDYFALFPKAQMKDKVFKYNNGGYVLLAAIVSKVSGMRYSQYVQSEIFDITGMTSSGFFAFDALPPNTALGYIGDENSFQTNIYKLPIIGGGDGGAYTNLHDIRVFWDCFLSGRIVRADAVSRYFDEYQIIDEKSGYYCGMWVNRAKNVFSLEGCDSGVSFASGYNKNTSELLTVISNTKHGVWPILDVL